MENMKSVIRLRMSAHDAHYGGNLVDGARMLGLFGDVATELLILNDGDEGLFKAYDEVEFMAREEVPWTLDGEFGGAHEEVRSYLLETHLEKWYSRHVK